MQYWQESLRAASPLILNVNLSGKQLREADLASQINQIVSQTGLSPASLKLEITESVFVKSAEAVSETLLQLQTQGVRFAIDDFGTGYSSLASLHRFPVDTLKIDKAFVEGMEADLDKVELVRVIITLAKNLGLAAIAEGVESSQQLALLQSLGCEYGQGHLFSKPVNADTATTLLKQSWGGFREPVEIPYAS
jgi:EAL domain-containing protein (putative c-di-GMP-specific phosphodiesterase class I)